MYATAEGFGLLAKPVNKLE
jgi:hypothetical protein